MRNKYATNGAVTPGPVFLEDAKGNQYDVNGNLIPPPPSDTTVDDAVRVARREADPYLLVPGHEHLTSVPPQAPPTPEYVPGETVSAATQPSRDLFWQGVEQFRNPQTEPSTPARAWELLSGAGNIGLGALGTGISGAIGAGVEALPSWLTGNQPQRNKLASELNEMTMFADPMLGPDALAATAPVQRVGGIRNATILEGDLAKQRMAERGPAQFYDPLKVSSGIDPTEAGKAAANVVDTAIAKAGEAASNEPVSLATRIAKGEFEDPNAPPPPAGITPPSNALQTQRGARTVISSTSVKLTDAEKAIVNSFDNKADRALVAARIRDTKARYPKSDGWAPFEATGASFDDKGNPVIEWQEQTYGFNTAVQPGNKTVVDPATGEKNKIIVNEPRALRPGTPDYEGTMRRTVRNGVNAVEDIIKRAAAGDENALRIIRQAGWYREFMRKGFDERGGSYPAFSDLLGATSPNTAVDQNYRYAVDLQNRFARGDFDPQVAFARDYTGSLNEFPEEQLIYRDPVGPKGPQKLQYGMNSRNAQMALADRWRAKEPGQAPKARNFSGNLGGATDEATIDVWAARFLNRMAGRRRLPPPVESGVKGKLGANLAPTGEFGFGQDAFRRITDELNRKGNLLPYLQELGYDRLTPMDMQALTWFIEKEHWTKKNWTTAAGEGGSFEDEMLRYPSERWQSGVSIQQDAPPSDAAMASTRNVFENSLRDDPNVNQYRVHPTIGRYAGNNERSFDLELTAKPGWDPRTWMAAVIREAKANNQYDVFFSKRLNPSAAQTNPNARPGVEIYFRDRKTLDDALPILEEFTQRNADGFTFVTDLRLRERELGGKEAPDFVGVRMQWVPEIAMRWVDDFRNQWANNPQALQEAKLNALNSMQDAINALDKAGLGIVDARVHHYDTLTVGKESYDKFLDGIADPANASGKYEGSASAAVDPVQRFGDSIHSHVAGRDRALRAGTEGGAADTAGDVVSAGQSSGALTPEQRQANFQNAFGQTYLKDPQGNPMRLYHMTPGDIRSFNAEEGNRSGPVVFLSPYADYQPAYHQAAERGSRGELTSNFKEGANVMPVYADVRNPLVLDHPRKIKEAAAKYQGGDPNFPRVVTPKAKKAMEADGFDAIIFGGDNPIPYGDRPMDARLGHQEARDEEFIIFDPKKIKSAIGNQGTYDLTTPDITKAYGGLVDDEDIYHAVRLARDVGGATNENPQVFLTDAQGRQYDAQGKPIAPAQTQEVSNSSATEQGGENINRAFNIAPQNYSTDVEPFINYAVTPVDRPGMPSEPDLVDVMKIATQVAAEGQPQEGRGEGNLSRRREEAVNRMYGVNPDRPNDPAANQAWIANQMVNFSPWALGEVAHDIPYEAGRTGDYGTAAVEGGLNALMTTPVLGLVGRGLKKGYETVKKLPALAAGAAGVAGLTAAPEEAEAGPARWFSKALEVAGALPMEKMTGQQALAMLKKSVSPEELRWTGTEAFLNSRPQVSKGELIEHLKSNRLQLNEVRLGEPGRQADYIGQIDPDIMAKYKPQIDAAEKEFKAAQDKYYEVAPSMQEEEARKYAYMEARKKWKQLELDAVMEHRARHDVAGPSKFENWSTQGGEGYRENLYALPTQDIYTPYINNLKNDYKASVIEEMRQHGFAEDRIQKIANNFVSNLSPQNMAKALGREEEFQNIYQRQRAIEEGVYRGPHWDQPDVLFHTRSQTLSYEPPGANRPYRVHNVDETQSDIGQTGRKKGFYDPQEYTNWETRYKASEAAIRQANQELDNRVKQIEATLPPEPYSYSDPRYNEWHAARQEALDSDPAIKEARRVLNDRIMQAREFDVNMPKVSGKMAAKPFVTSTEGWTDRAIKQELDKALDSDSDYFSWTPGEEHAARYDLSKHISKIQYNPDDGSFLAYDPKGRMVVNESVNDPSDLDEYIGKELADKVRAEEENRRTIIDEYEISKDDETGQWQVSLYGEPTYAYGGEPLLFDSKYDAKEYLKELMANDFSSNPVELSGLDLKVGGEGMKGYYDKVYFNRVRKVLEKATGIKNIPVEEIEVQTAGGPRKQLGIRLTDEMREKARFSDFARGGTVTGGGYRDSNDAAVNRALALTREY